jgi:predicted acetyltransferase
MGQATLTLVSPAVTFQAEMLAMIAEYTALGDQRYQDIAQVARTDFAAYIRQLEEMSQGIDLPPGYVPQTTFWSLREDNLLIGTSRLRHWLTPVLEQYGGHIGYDIRPSQRGRGYGTCQLALTLEKARELGLRRVLLTCDTDNVASARVIEKNGGQLAEQVVYRKIGKLVSRYWIDLS